MTDLDAMTDFHAHELLQDAEAAADTRWERFVDLVAARLGLDSLDGDNSAAAKAAGTADGYSLDEAYDLWSQGHTVATAANHFRVRILQARG